MHKQSVAHHSPTGAQQVSKHLKRKPEINSYSFANSPSTRNIALASSLGTLCLSAPFLAPHQ